MTGRQQCPPDLLREADMSASGSGKTVYLEVGVWWNEATGHIHLAAKDVEGFITTVCDDPAGQTRASEPIYEAGEGPQGCWGAPSGHHGRSRGLAAPKMEKRLADA